MTVCVAAICEGGNAVVAASDRMLTSSYPPVEFEHTNPKVQKLGSHCAVMTSGDALKPIQIVPSVQAAISEQTHSPAIAQIADLTKQFYQADRLRLAEELLLKPRTINSQTFYSKGQHLFPRDLFGFIDDQFARFDFGLEMLIAGVDQMGASIYAISNPGIASCFNTLGFSAIGVGQLHAVQAFVGQRYSVNANLANAMPAVYAAKKAAETAPGVGEETDMLIITPRGIDEVSKADLKTLQDIYDEVTAPRAKEIEEASKKLRAAQNAKKGENQ